MANLDDVARNLERTKEVVREVLRSSQKVPNQPPIVPAVKAGIEAAGEGIKQSPRLVGSVAQDGGRWVELARLSRVVPGIHELAGLRLAALSLWMASALVRWVTVVCVVAFVAMIGIAVYSSIKGKNPYALGHLLADRPPESSPHVDPHLSTESSQKTAGVALGASGGGSDCKTYSDALTATKQEIANDRRVLSQAKDWGAKEKANWQGMIAENVRWAGELERMLTSCTDSKQSKQLQAR